MTSVQLYTQVLLRLAVGPQGRNQLRTSCSTSPSSSLLSGMRRGSSRAARLERHGPENDHGDADSEQNGRTGHGAIPDPQVRDDRPREVKNRTNASCDSDGPPGETDEQTGHCCEFECGEHRCRFGRFHKLQDGHLVWVFADLADCGENEQGREEDAEDGCCNEHWSYPF